MDRSTGNALYEAASQIVLSSDRSPTGLATIAQRLRDRFRWASRSSWCRLIMMPGSRSSVAASPSNLPVAEDPLGYIAERTSDSLSLRVLNGAVIRLLGAVAISDYPLDRELIDSCLPPPGSADRSPLLV